MDKQVSSDALTIPWQRLSPIAMVYFYASGIKIAANNIIYLLPAFAISYATLQENPQVWLPILIAVLSLIGLFSVLNYFFYTFRLDATTVEIRSGIFSKAHTNLPFSRIQNVSLEQPIYYRFLNYCSMQLDTAGSTKQEAKIVALPLDVAQTLKKRILQVSKHKDEDTLQADDESATSNHEEIINQRSLGDLVIHGITNNRVWIIFGFLAPFYDNIANSIAGYLGAVGLDLGNWFDPVNQSVIQVVLAISGIVVLVVLFFSLLSVIGSIIVFYGYTLSRDKDRYVRRSGLLTKQEITMRLSRLQMIVKHQDWLDLVFGRSNLELRQNSAGMQASDPTQTSLKIMVPSVSDQQAQDITSDAWPENHMYQVNFQAISKRYIVRQFLTWLLPLWIIALSAAIVNQETSLIVTSAIALPLLMGLVWCRWKRWGIAQDEEFLYIRKGLFGMDLYCFPIYKIQQVKMSQSYLMKRNNLANIKLVLACGAVNIPFVYQKLAVEVIDKSLYKVESEGRSWM